MGEIEDIPTRKKVFRVLMRKKKSAEKVTLIKKMYFNIYGKEASFPHLQNLLEKQAFKKDVLNWVLKQPSHTFKIRDINEAASKFMKAAKENHPEEMHNIYRLM